VITAQPCSEDPCQIYTPKKESLYVLELNAWITQQIGIISWSMMNIYKK
jgi:uncharacterized membrane protein (UPF0127 family)